MQQTTPVATYPPHATGQTLQAGITAFLYTLHARRDTCFPPTTAHLHITLLPAPFSQNYMPRSLPTVSHQCGFPLAANPPSATDPTCLAPRCLPLCISLPLTVGFAVTYAATPAGGGRAHHPGFCGTGRERGTDCDAHVERGLWTHTGLCRPA